MYTCNEEQWVSLKKMAFDLWNDAYPWTRCGPNYNRFIHEMYGAIAKDLDASPNKPWHFTEQQYFGSLASMLVWNMAKLYMHIDMHTSDRQYQVDDTEVIASGIMQTLGSSIAY